MLTPATPSPTAEPLHTRRRCLGWLAGAATLPAALSACHGNGAGATVAKGGGSRTDGRCAVVPSETAGPYPGDGTNTSRDGVVNALLLSGIVRADLRSSVGTASGTAAGVPMTVTLTLVDAANACTPLAGRAVYLWHCTREGGYSLYSHGVTDQNYLRGVQVSDAQGQVSFTTVFPGCYSGRWPHMHFEVFASLAQATRGTHEVKTSQLALPASACTQVYGAASGYDSSLRHFNEISLDSDNVFGDDNAARQLATVTGDLSSGFAATLTVGLTT